jgi:hypothetical protein
MPAEINSDAHRLEFLHPNRLFRGMTVCQNGGRAPQGPSTQGKLVFSSGDKECHYARHPGESLAAKTEKGNRNTRHPGASRGPAILKQQGDKAEETIRRRKL